MFFNYFVDLGLRPRVAGFLGACKSSSLASTFAANSFASATTALTSLRFLRVTNAPTINPATNIANVINVVIEYYLLQYFTVATINNNMTKTELNKLSKEELEELGRTKGVELDRRLTKSKLVTQIAGLFKGSSTSSSSLRKQIEEEHPNWNSKLIEYELKKRLSEENK